MDKVKNFFHKVVIILCILYVPYDIYSNYLLYQENLDIFRLVIFIIGVIFYINVFVLLDSHLKNK